MSTEPVPSIPLLTFLEDQTMPIKREQALKWIGLSLKVNNETFKIIGVDNKPPKLKEGLHLVLSQPMKQISYLTLIEA